MINKILPMSNCDSLIDKKNSWICFLEENGKIIDLQVYELDNSYPEKWEFTVNFVTKIVSSEQKMLKDFGRVCMDWEEWTIADVLFKIGIQYGFLSINHAKYCMNNLSKIKEFKEPIYCWLRLI